MGWLHALGLVFAMRGLCAVGDALRCRRGGLVACSAQSVRRRAGLYHERRLFADAGGAMLLTMGCRVEGVGGLVQGWKGWFH